MSFLVGRLGFWGRETHHKLSLRGRFCASSLIPPLHGGGRLFSLARRNRNSFHHRNFFILGCSLGSSLQGENRKISGQDMAEKLPSIFGCSLWKHPAFVGIVPSKAVHNGLAWNEAPIPIVQCLVSGV